MITCSSEECSDLWLFFSYYTWTHCCTSATYFCLVPVWLLQWAKSLQNNIHIGCECYTHIYIYILLLFVITFPTFPLTRVCVAFLAGRAKNTSQPPRWHPFKMSRPPQLAPFYTKEQRLCPVSLTDDSATCYGHDPPLMTIGKSRKKECRSRPLPTSSALYSSWQCRKVSTILLQLLRFSSLYHTSLFRTAF